EVAAARGLGAGERAFRVAEEGGKGRVAPQHRAVDLDEGARELAPLLLQVVDALREQRLARARRSHEQDRLARVDRDLFDLLHQAVERLVARIDAALQEREPLLLLEAEARGE